MSTLKQTQVDTRGMTWNLLILAAPIILMMVSRMLMGFIDFWMVKYLGTTALAAISPAVMLVFTVGCVWMGVTNGVQTFVSQADGRGEQKICGAYGWQGMYIAAVSTLITWPLAATTEQWYGALAAFAKHEPEMARLEIEYTKIALWSIPFSVLSMGFNAFFMGIQKPRIALAAVFVSLVVNAVGDYLLVFGHYGFPEMGIAGAAVATVIGWAVRAVFLGLAMLLPQYDRLYNTRRSLAPSLSKLGGLLKIGGPTAVQWLVDIGSWLVFLAVIMPPFGVKAVAASNIGLQLMHLSFMPAIGIGIALCSQVGFAIGEQDIPRARAQARVAMRLTGIYMSLGGVMFITCGRLLTWMFDQDPEVIRLGQLVLIGVAVFQFFDAMCITYMNALRGAGDTRWPAVAVFVCCWGIFIGGGMVISHYAPHWGVLGPWGTCAVYIILLGLTMRWRWNGGAWEHIDLFNRREDKPDPEATRATLPDEASAVAELD